MRELHPGTERVICLDERDGSQIWKREYPCDYTSVATYAIGPRCTPIVDDQRVYSLGAEGDLYCLDTNNGKTIWSKNFVKDFGLQVPEWGVASHPLVDGNRLICIAGGKNTCIAFDKTNGKVIWQGTEHWDDLLAERAGISGKLVLSEFTKNFIKQFQTK